MLDGFVCYGADTAGCSLKSAQAAAVLVEYLSRADISAETVTDWQGGLDAQQQELLVLNWDGILYNARQICEDPADGSGLLEAAGVTTDFGTIDLSAVPQRLDALDEVLRLRRADPTASLESIAQQLGCSLSTVKRHLRKARRGEPVGRPKVTVVPPSVEQVLDAYRQVVANRPAVRPVRKAA